MHLLNGHSCKHLLTRQLMLLNPSLWVKHGSCCMMRSTLFWGDLVPHSSNGAIDEGPLRYVLSHHHLHLVLDLGPDGGCDAAGQLISGALKAVDHLLELPDHGVPCVLLSLLPVLHVGVELLDVCRDQNIFLSHTENQPSCWFHNTDSLKVDESWSTCSSLCVAFKFLNSCERFGSLDWLRENNKDEKY